MTSRGENSAANAMGKESRDNQTSIPLRKPRPTVRFLALLQALLLLFSGSPSLMALQFNAGLRSSGSSGGGQGSAPSLQNAGAASAALTAALAKKSLQKSQEVIKGLTTAQTEAADAAKADLNNGTIGTGPSAKTVVNGLQITAPTGANQAPGLVPYYSAPPPAGPNIPNGSVPVPGTWSGVSGVSQSVSGPAAAPSSATVTITQNQQTANLYWSHFNVGPQTTLNFNQSAGGANAGTWIAFNKVMTASDPSHIFGKINATGQVYIQNQGGILFHAGSKVNVQSLVAASLPINPNLAGDPLRGIKTGQGLANNPDRQFLFSALPVSAGTVGPTAAWTPSVSSPIGDVVVESGASINAAVNAANSGGLVALVAPNVINKGTISTPNGQAVLAAGLQVGMTPHPTADPSLRGLDFYVGKVADPSISTVSASDGAPTTGNTGVARNEGLILIPDGNATMVGKAVLQNGGIAGTTSVSFNGRIDLLANYNTTINSNYKQQGQALLYQSTGLVQMGPGSAMQILPEWDSSATVTGTTLALNSLVSIQGSSVDFGPGSVLVAPGAGVTPGAFSETGLKLSSGVTVQAGKWYDDGSHSLQFIQSGGQIYLGPSSVIDVSGSTDVRVSSAQNFVTLQLRGAQLAGEPLQDNGQNPIYGQNLTVDIRDSGTYNGQYWIGTPLGDATGYAALVQKGVGQLTLNGGSVALQAGDSVVEAPGSQINVSGGWVQYSGGSYAVSQLVNSLGQVVPIYKATPNLPYISIVKDPAMIYEAPYVSGGNGGGISIQAASVALDGSLHGNTVAGPRQLRPWAAGSASSLPLPSSFTLALFEQKVLNNSPALVSPYAPDVVFAVGPIPEGVSSFALDVSGNPLPLPASRQSSIYLDPQIASLGGFGQIAINDHDGAISIPAAAVLNLGPDGSLSMGAANISVAGNVFAPGGSISLTAYRVSDELDGGLSTIGIQTAPFLDVLRDSSGSQFVQYGAVANDTVQVIDANGVISTKAYSSLTPVSAGGVVVAQGVRLDVSGSIANDMAGQSGGGAIPILSSGGSIQIGGYNVALSPGAYLNVSGGGYVSGKGAISYGNAGSISISGGQDIQQNDMHGGILQLGSTMTGFAGTSLSGGGSPGSLSITAPEITIGGIGSSGISLPTSFFNQGGFGSFALTGFSGVGNPGDQDYQPGILVASGAVINPQIQGKAFAFTDNQTVMTPFSLPGPLGHSANLSLNAKGVLDSSLPDGQRLLVRGDLVQQSGSEIILRPSLKVSSGVASASSGSLSLSGMTVEELGSIVVPGGSVVIKGGGSLVSNLLQNNPYGTVDLGSTASVSVDGKALYTEDPGHVRSSFGSVLSGGSVTITGNLVAHQGSTIEANGSSGVFSDLGNGGKLTAFRADSTGGSIALYGGQAFYSDAVLTAAAGGSSAQGGSLSISSGNFESGSVSDPSLVITASGFSSPTGVAGVAQALPATDPFGAPGGGHVSVSSFQNGGFSSVTLSGNVLFAGSSPIVISSGGSIVAGTGGVIQSEAEVTLNAPVIQLGMTFANPLAPSSSQFKTVLGTITSPLFARPSYGNGNLQINAGSLINVGNLSLQGIGTAGLSVAHGDIRGDGNLVMAGDLTLAASQIYPSTGTVFTAVAFNHDSGGNSTGDAPNTQTGIVAGSITVQTVGQAASTPLSAGGSLNLYASQITQGGVLKAPFGNIALGATEGTSNSKDPMSGIAAPDAATLTLTGASITSVSGAGVVVPYGLSTDGSTWIDPAGSDITTIGLPTKAITLKAGSTDISSGASLDLQGGGELKALDWVPGLGGTVNILGSASDSWNSHFTYNQGDLVSYQGKTWSARQPSTGAAPSVGPNWTLVPQAYAILPGYQTTYAPTGYGDGSLAVGSTVELNGGSGLSSGSYTLLPASYASLPGAYLLSVSSLARNTEVPISIAQPDGTTLVSGTLYNTLAQGVTPAPNTSLFLLSTPAELAKQVLYQNLSASSFFASTGTPLPANGGNLTVSSTSLVNSINFGSGVRLNASGTGTTPGGLVALTAPGQFSIGAGGGAGVVQIDPSLLNQWQYGGLLIGGKLASAVSGSAPTVDVTASSVTVGQNVSLTGNDIILAASQSINVLDGSFILSQGSSHSPYEQIAVNGNGVLLRVSGDFAASETRSGVSSASSSVLTLGQGVVLGGNSVVVDTSGNALIDSTSQFQAKSLSLAAGSMAMVLDAQPSQALINDLAGNEPAGMVLQGAVLQSAAAAKALSLTSYSTLDFYGSPQNLANGSFGSQNMTQLALHTGEIRGFDLNGATAAFTAQSIILDNASGSPSSGPITSLSDGSLELDAATISLGKNTLAIDQFANVSLNATGVIAGTSSGAMNVGTPAIPSSFYMTAPLITATAGNTLTVTASGDLLLQAPDGGAATTPSIPPGAGITMNFTGSTVAVDTTLSAPSGQITLHATGGDVVIGGQGTALLDVSGTSKKFDAIISSADAGSIRLVSDTGNVALGVGATLNLSGTGASSAGTLSVIATQGAFLIDPVASLNAVAGANGGANGSLSLDVATLNPSGTGPSQITAVASQLSAANFTQSLTLRIRTGDVDLDTYVAARNFSLIVDQGSIDVTPNGVVDASGATGGSIALQASGSVILEPNSLLNVHGDTYDSAGKGGVVFLSAGAETTAQINPNAVLDLQTASAIDLGVTATPSSGQQLGGVLHLRAPITQDGTDIQMASLDSTVSGASSIAVEGYRTYDLTGTSGEITQSLRQQVNSDEQAFYGSSGGNSDSANAIMNRLAANQPTSVSSVMNLAPGVEIINQSGDLTLNQDWDLSTFRVGANSAPGFLTLRASGNVTLNASLSDGFTSSAYTASLLTLNQNLPVNFQSWGYTITAGSDLSSASTTAYLPGNAGNMNLGVSANSPILASGGSAAQTSSPLQNYYQVIRTGTGDIAISASGDIHLWNQFASIYTAGSQLWDPTMGGTFDVPTPVFTDQNKTPLGSVQQLTPYPAQFSQAGGNIVLQAGGNIAHVSRNSRNVMVQDSTAELPSNWLYRRGAVDANGNFLQVSSPTTEVESTSWWVDFSNFFEGVGALGGGNVSMLAGGNISNVDAVIPTNFRMPGHLQGSGLSIAPSLSSGLELGGGNLSVSTSGNLNAGVYYVESGTGALHAGGSIVTDATRDPQLSQLINPSSTPSTPESYLPTTLFLGKGSFSVTAGGSITLGPVGNAFLLPQGINNSFWYKTYFSTYDPSDSVKVVSLGGDVTLRTAAFSPGSSALLPMLQLWMQDMISPLPGQPGTIAGYYEPWLRLAESSVSSMGGTLSLLPSSLSLGSYSGDINLQGGVTLSPSSTGGLQLLAAGSINGLTASGFFSGPQIYSASTINVSDANPASIPGVASPLSFRASLASAQQGLAGSNGRSGQATLQVSALFQETGSTFGGAASLQSKLTLHDSTSLHAGDANPLELFAGTGNISGLTLYSPKYSRIIAGGDITDVGLYIQNVSSTDVSIVSASGSIIPYDPSSPLQKIAQAVDLGSAAVPLQSGDIQISGPGTLEVLAGGNVNLGDNPGSTDPTLNVGITSIGNARNPALPFQGADLIVSAGVKLPSGLSSQGALALDSFAKAVVNGADGETYLSELSAQMAYSGDPLLSGLHNSADFGSDSTLTPDQKARLELQLFYIVLRDTGRNYSNPDSSGYRSYAAAEQALQTVLNGNNGPGNIITWSQNIATVNGGNIDLLVPGGEVTMGAINYKAAGSSVAPGIITEGGGAINILTKQSVSIGIGRIFSLKGGDILIWSDKGNIAAGASSKTVQSAPPTQVLVDPQSALVEADLAGLATGGGIGTLQTVIGIPPSAVDLVAPSGVIDAGDAGIRSSGNLHLAATAILNAANIAVGGLSVGVPPAAASSAPAAAAPAAPAAASAPSSAASTAAAAASNSADKTADKGNSNQEDSIPSEYTITIDGYGGSADDEDSKKAANAAVAPIQASL
jgi:filamentous hemagglutinin family protein